MTTVAETIRQYDAWHAEYGFDLWGGWGEENEVHYDDPDLDQLLADGRIVSLVDYGCECDIEYDHDDECIWLAGESDWVMEGWARVDVIRRVTLPKGWKLERRGSPATATQ